MSDQRPEVHRILPSIEPRLLRTPDDSRPVVVMMCGLSDFYPTGSGKSSLAHAITAAHSQFTRISIDGTLHALHGRYRIDYAPELYEQYQNEAEAVCNKQLTDLLAKGQDVVLDRSFYAKEDRDAFKKVIEKSGGRWLLVYHRCRNIEGLWKRIEDRKARRGTLGGDREGDATFDVTREILQRYWDGWEAPDGEGEVVYDVV